MQEYLVVSALLLAAAETALRQAATLSKPRQAVWPLLRQASSARCTHTKGALISV
jgi:hypothetical protein